MLGVRYLRERKREREKKRALGRPVTLLFNQYADDVLQTMKVIFLFFFLCED